MKSDLLLSDFFVFLAQEIMLFLKKEMISNESIKIRKEYLDVRITSVNFGVSSHLCTMLISSNSNIPNVVKSILEKLCYDTSPFLDLDYLNDLLVFLGLSVIDDNSPWDGEQKAVITCRNRHFYVRYYHSSIGGISISLNNKIKEVQPVEVTVTQWREI